MTLNGVTTADARYIRQHAFGLGKLIDREFVTSAKKIREF